MKNKKFLFLNIFVILAIIFSVVYVLSVGSHYTMHAFIHLSDAEPPKTEVTMQPEGVVELENVRLENGELVFDFRAVRKGETTIRAGYLHSEDAGMIYTMDRTFRVGAFNIILEQIDGMANFNGYREVIFVILATLLVMVIILLWSFLEYRRKGKFGYQMVACGGLSIYLAVVLAFVSYKLLNNAVFSFGKFFHLVADTGILLLIGLMPAMLVLSVLLALSNIWLMRHEGRRPVNALGIVFGILWFAATILTVGTETILVTSWSESAFFDVFRSALVYILGYFECLFLSTVACAFLAARFRPSLDRDFVIILGCGINKDGTLKPLIRGRVDAALAFAKKQEEANGRTAVFVPSGGQGANEGTSEGEAMARYLRTQGIPEERILAETKSTTTYENMKFSKAVIEANAGDITKKNVAFATTNYHIFRGYVLAQKNGFEVQGISAKTKFYFYPNAFLREFAGLIVDRKWQHLLAIAVILAFFLGIRYFL